MTDPRDTSTMPVELVEASTLCGVHVGRIARLAGRFDGHRWHVTDAPITMITHKRDGTVKVRRHPDGHTDHELDPRSVVPLVRVCPGGVIDAEHLKRCGGHLSAAAAVTVDEANASRPIVRRGIPRDTTGRTPR